MRGHQYMNSFMSWVIAKYEMSDHQYMNSFMSWVIAKYEMSDHQYMNSCQEDGKDKIVMNGR